MAKILVVDDEPDLVRFVVKILRQAGHEVLTAAEGQEALDMAQRERPDVIILDLNLPRMDGEEVCRRLKGDEGTLEIPVLMMTGGYVRLEDAEKSGEPGPDAYVVKPFLRDLLLHNVERLLEAEQRPTIAPEAV